MHSSDSESPPSPEVFSSSDDEQHDGTNDIACDSDEETGSVSHDHLEEPPYKTPSTRNIAEWFCARKPTIRSGMQNAISSHRAEHGGRPITVASIYTGWATAEMCGISLARAYNAAGTGEQMQALKALRLYKGLQCLSFEKPSGGLAFYKGALLICCNTSQHIVG